MTSWSVVLIFAWLFTPITVLSRVWLPFIFLEVLNLRFVPRLTTFIVLDYDSYYYWGVNTFAKVSA